MLMSKARQAAYPEKSAPRNRSGLTTPCPSAGSLRVGRREQNEALSMELDLNYTKPNWLDGDTHQT